MYFRTRSAVVLAACVLLGLASAPAYADALQKILESKKLKVGTEAAMPPFEFVQEGKIVGYGKDILDYIVKSEKFDLEQTNLPWQGILPALTAGRFDLVATSVTISPERAQKFAFTLPIAESTYFAIKRKGDTRFKTTEDLSGSVIGAQLGSASEATGKAFDAKLKASGKPGLKDLKLYISYQEVYLGLANGELDAAIHSLPSLTALMKERPGLFELIGPVRDKTYYGWLTRSEDTALRDFINKKLKELRDSGELSKLQDKWFGFRMELPEKGYLPDGAV